MGMKVILQQLFTPEQTINSERGSALCDDGSSQKTTWQVCNLVGVGLMKQSRKDQNEISRTPREQHSTIQQIS